MAKESPSYILGKRKDAYLEKLYFDESLPTGFSTPRRMYEYVKERGKYKLSEDDIKRWLSSNTTYTTHRASRKKFRRLNYVVPRPLYQYDMDSFYMTEYKAKSGNKFGIVLVDAFSRKVHVLKVKSLKGKDVSKALDEFFTHHSKPTRIYHDSGSEYISHLTSAVLKKHNIKQIRSRNQTKASLAEAVIKRIKRTIGMKLVTIGSQDWDLVVDDIVRSYNNSRHRITKHKPSEIDEKNIHKVHQALEKYRLKNAQVSVGFKYDIDDDVRVSLIKGVGSKIYDESFSHEIYKIASREMRQGIPLYVLKQIENNEVIDGKFYENQIQKVLTTKDTRYKIEKILETSKRRGISYSLVKWIGYKEKSWIPTADIENLSSN